MIFKALLVLSIQIQYKYILFYLFSGSHMLDIVTSEIANNTNITFDYSYGHVFFKEVVDTFRISC